jgi:cell division protein ZapA
MHNLIPINIIIGDRSYRIKIQPKDEEFVRKTVKTINEKIVEFKTMFAGKDMQDYTAMVLVWFATEEHPPGSYELDTEKITGKLSQIEKLLDARLLEFSNQ